MGNNKIIPTTGEYNLSIKVDIQNAELLNCLRDAAYGSRSNESISSLTKALVGRDDIQVIENDEGDIRYDLCADTIYYDSGALTVDRLLCVPKVNVPPHIFQTLTSEMISHILMVHEIGHAAQHSFSRDVNTGRVIMGTVKSNVFDDPLSFKDADYFENDLKGHFAHELDSDLLVIMHLVKADFRRVAQFFMDARITSSFAMNIPELSFTGLTHGTSSLLYHFAKTRDVIDLDFYLSEKQSLIEKINNEMGLNTSDIETVAKDYPEISNEEFTPSETLLDAQFVKHQGIMCAVQNLLERGDLSEMQSVEAETYLQAVERIGYKSDPSYDYIAQIRSILENGYGLVPFSRRSSVDLG